MVSTLEARPRAHDPELLDRLASLEQSQFLGEVWRATRQGQNPTAFSYNGGRWAPPSSYQSVPTLYTSLTRQGAIAEMTSWLNLLVPRPSKPITVHRLQVTASQVVSLTMQIIGQLGVDTKNYAERNYVAMFETPPSRTQEVGAALSFLEIDGVLVPSARAGTQNLVLYDNANNRVEVDVLESETVDWVADNR
jgi:RES domain